MAFFMLINLHENFELRDFPTIFELFLSWAKNFVIKILIMGYTHFHENYYTFYSENC